MRSIPNRSAAACALASGALALTATLAACSGSSTTAQPGPGASASGTGASSGGGSYSDSSDVISALKSAGHPCTPVSGSQDTALTAPGLRSVTACTIGSSGGSSESSANTVTATVFDNHTDAQAYATLLTSSQNSGLLIGSTSARAVLGQNWVVLVPDDTAYAGQVSAALGGSVLGAATNSAAAG